MTKQEQIKEMQEIIGGCWEFDSIDAELGSGDGYIDIQESAEALYNAGYQKGETTSYQAMIDHSFLDYINQLENILVEVRKETAKDMAEKLKDAFTEYDIENMCPALYWDDFCYILNKVLKEYEIEE